MTSEGKEFVTWQSKYSSGIKLIDDQHKGLVNLVNEMFNHVTGNDVKERDYFNKVIQEAVKYVKIHFATEEKIMIATKFPDYVGHKKEHDSFVLAVVENIRDYEAGKRHTLSTFTRFLRDWVLSHIALMDTKYFDYFQKIATRKADGKLSINLNDINNQ